MIPAEPIMRAVLLKAARAYAAAHRLPLWRVSRAVYGNSDFLEKLSRRQVSFTAAKYDQMMGWFAEPAQWPDGSVSPDVTDVFAANPTREPAP